MANWQRRMAPYLFISPFFIGFAVFFLYPVLWALYLSFFQQAGIGSEPKFVGLENYINLLSDELFRKALVNTTYYAGGQHPVIVPVALGAGAGSCSCATCTGVSSFASSSSHPLLRPAWS